jgi:chemotaxis protein MotA
MDIARIFSNMDVASAAGIVLAIAGIVGGMMMEGGNLGQIMQPTALLIVLGGTAGAVLLQFPLNILSEAIRQLRRVFLAKPGTDEAVIGLLVAFAGRARKHGVVSLDDELVNIEDPFLQRALMLAIDGSDPSAVRAIMSLQMDNAAEHEDKIVHVFEAAGGFSPTVGIIGAVLGLIQVMQHLDKIDEVGRGIAVAFVATIYGVGLANLICLPMAGKLKIRFQEKRRSKEMMLDGVISILEGMNPHMIDTKLRTYLEGTRLAKAPKDLAPQGAKLAVSEGIA